MKHLLFLASLVLILGNCYAQQKRAMQASIREAILEQIQDNRNRVDHKIDSISKRNGITFSPQEFDIAHRLKTIEKVIPLEYNESVRPYLMKYISQNYKPYMEKLLGLGQYYFPIYEQIFEETGIPEEVKYLSAIESSLNPHTLSSAGALGPWQFIYSTAKVFDLSMDSYFDERKDVYSSTYAVSRYLAEAYDEFNDWLLALASYNCGRGCVRRAIARSGMRAPSFWELSPYLPTQTRNYIPKFIAMTYVLSNPEVYNLTPEKNDLQNEYKVLMVNKSVPLSSVAEAVNVPMSVMQEFNPAYKRQVVNGTNASPRRIIVPIFDHVDEELLYTALNNNIQREDVALHAATASSKTEFHRVQSGETLPIIAKRYGVTVKELIAWNNLGATSALNGKTILIKPSKANSYNSIAQASQQSNSGNSGKIENPIIHTVKKGENLASIVAKYKGTTVTKLKARNNLRGDRLSIGQKIRIN